MSAADIQCILLGYNISYLELALIRILKFTMAVEGNIMIEMKKEKELFPTTSGS